MNSPDLDLGLKILSIIARHTQDDPVKGDLAAEMCGSNARTVAEVLSIAVANGCPFASNSRGYFRWRNSDEREAYFAREKSRLVSLGRKLSQGKKHRLNELTLFEA